MVQSKKTRGLGDVIHRVQSDTDETIERNVPDWIRNGKLIKDITLTPSALRRVPHGLGRHHQGWTIFSPRATGGTMVYEVKNERDPSALVLQSPGAITVDVWIW